MTKVLTLNKLAAGLVGLAMVAGLASAVAVQRAQAADLTLSDLVEFLVLSGVIADDKADEARKAVKTLEAEKATTPTAPAAASCNFTRDLKTGLTGADVKELQKVLNSKGFTVAAMGAGSVGMETEYYGPATAAAVAKMQEAFAADILAPLGLTKGTGFFGAATRKVANEKVCATVVPPVLPPEDEDDEDMDDEDTDNELSGGEASLGALKVLNSPKSVEVQEGDEEVAVAGFEFDVDDADAELNRVDVMFEVTASTGGNASDEPWDYFESVQLSLNGEVVAEENADSESDWDDMTKTGGYASDAYRLRFTGIEELLAADETAELEVSVTVQGGIDSEDEDATFTVWIPENGVRARDGEGLDDETGDDGETRTFAMEAAGQGEELKIALASSNPNESTVNVDDQDTTDDISVMVFTLEAKEGDIEITELPVLFATDDAQGVLDVLDDARLMVSGKEIGSVKGTVGTTTTFEFDNGEFVIDADSKVTVEVVVDILANDDYIDYTTISASIGVTERNGIDAEGSDTLANGDKTGTATGEDHALVEEGLAVEIVSTDADIRTINNGTEDVVDFVVKFDLSAFDNTFYVGSTTAAVTYHVERNGVDIGTASTTAVDLTSTADEQSNGNWMIDEDGTETFTLTVTVNPDLTGSYRVVLDSVDYSVDNTGTVDDATTPATPVSDFRTDTKAVAQ